MNHETGAKLVVDPWANVCRAKWLGISSLLLAVTFVIASLFVSGPRQTFEIDPSAIGTAGGHSYTFVLPVKPAAFFLRVAADSPSYPARSRARLLENGKLFGVPHSSHEDILARGGGQFSHWDTTLYFSTNDNSDPRTNGHAYSIEVSYQFPRWFSFIFVIAGAGLLLPLLIADGRDAKWDTKDLTCIATLLLIAGLEMFLVWMASPVPVIAPTTDGGNIAAFTVGTMYPDRFVTDFLLSDPSNTSFYISVFRDLIRFAGTIFGDIGTGYIALFLPVTIVQLVGYYALGRILTGDRIAGLLLALFTNVPINVWGFNEIFGAYYVPLPRTVYDAFLPLLMIGFIRFGDRTITILAMCLLCGLSFYVHPVSAPSVAAGLLLASYATKPTEQTYLRRTVILFAGGMIFLASALPFIMPFLTSFSGGLEQASAQQDPDIKAALQVFKERNGALYRDAVLALTTLLDNLRRVWPVWLIGAIGLIFLPRFDPTKKRYCHFLLLFLAGISLASFGVSLIDQIVAERLGRAPVQLDLIRGLRFFQLPLLIGFVMAIVSVGQYVQRWMFSSIAFKATVSITSLALLGIWWNAYPNWLSSRLGLREMMPWATPSSSDPNEILAYLKTRPVDGTILPIGDSTVGLAVRYAAMQPVAFLPNDSNALFYSGSRLRGEWFRLNSMLEVARTEGPAATAALRDLVVSSGARYVLLQNSALSLEVTNWLTKRSDVVMAAGSWQLLQPRATFKDIPHER